VLEYLVVLRLSEQYLVRAEARTHLNDLSGAAADINVVRNRAGLPDTKATDKTSLLDAIAQERRVELFAEWGHRWLDLKRTATIDTIMNIVSLSKGSSWNTNAQLYPIPAGDILLNPYLTQNPGY
jgi:hypothetical protein